MGANILQFELIDVDTIFFFSRLSSCPRQKANKQKQQTVLNIERQEKHQERHHLPLSPPPIHHW